MKGKKGAFIVFEGIDGCGKSFQAERILHYLGTSSQKKLFGHRGVYLTKEPTANLIGGLIRSQLNHDWKSSPECLQLLFAADRAHHLVKEVIPLLQRGITVLCDRYFFSSIAYGGITLDMKWLHELNKNFLFPDLTFFFRVRPRIGLKRIAGNRYEMALFEKEKELKAVAKNFLAITRQFKNMHTVDGEKSPDHVTHMIVNILHQKLS